MPVAVLSDIHGNLPALRAVLAELEREDVSAVVVGGDVASGPLPGETLEVLMQFAHRWRFVRGNADREIVAAFDQGRLAVEAAEGPAERAAAFAAARVTREQRDFLAGFADSVVLEVDGLGPALFCHGSPRSDTEIITTATSDERLRTVLEGVKERVVVCGHTHRQFDRGLERWRIVNAGSVGLPYEGRAGAYWALLGPDVLLRRTDYDLHAALAQLRGGGFTDLDDMLRESLLEPMDPNEVAAFFERGALEDA